ncbi:D-tagatose-bisphosphate aldolase, class II, non-catalytic subunit [Roseospira visakhapatnamensis]|uniref:D-tagatose-1,6-bisphosphate aldolase subunit GatZ/KbaZ n=1 Tax=Roseospira visakhapatnamensis TaxID=390880 RepID=A0A7W6RDL8_9PROT|nr:D-tagatose-bisphosphate aldolase, class II, non-catalytic subunit [Roseospira visakhapatnamensis]MBB4266385.1 D-tagatose-1,6-bisphosphate aldolase subunit GatZ/KbaZ [Roseospira visakhapatnamensis]
MKDVVLRHVKGEAVGICSVCSAHPIAIRAALLFDLDTDRTVLIEATSNQVNQFGGYTGMTPVKFRDFVAGIAAEVGFPLKRLCLGGDHLGPNAWRDRTPDEAMALSRTLVADYVAAGFSKIHLDASMAVAGDVDPIDPGVAAERAADLCAAAEAAVTDGAPPLYIIGTEVPVPGGETDGLSGIQITDPANVAQTLDLHRRAFAARGLDAAFARVVGVVVQPGVDFDHTGIIAYDRTKAFGLARFIEGHPGLVYEAHSTDFQPREKLRDLVRDHFAILKVGPAVTFALREGLFALAAMEDETIPVERRSCLRAVVDRVMLDEPDAWAKYYQGGHQQRKLLRSYSKSDRIRYYWTHPEVSAAVDRLFANLAAVPPTDGLVRQFAGHERARRPGRPLTAETIILDKIMQVLEDYRHACWGDADSGGATRRAG